ncbi:MAG TPA: DUF992 domain-containing protein [Pseudolabrys sp.]|nr:DUF992 domain-containing protein [Pseudolabrys sp.]
MKTRLAIIAAAAGIAGLAATSVPASAAVEVGVLRCKVEPSVGYVVASERWMRCAFHPNDGSRPQYYRGRAGRIGIDFGVTNDAVLVWGVFAPTRRLTRHALAGTYAGASAGAAIGAGVGANALLGGSHNTIALQPLSAEGSTGLSVALGVTALSLR